MTARGCSAAPHSFEVGYSPLSVATGDLNGDGRPDLVVCIYQEQVVRVLLNDLQDPQAADANDNGVPDACEVRLADMNCDGSVDFFDIDPFLLALFDPAGYAAAYPSCNINNGDINEDTNVDFFDIDPFLECLFDGCP